ncbi:MAG TPA: gamma-glutamylcyclotransferase family protein [Sphingobium sp.]|uniref:gamma-glutamylcyclotransferase family protein n=1 Tax=Sphingobium sp. TaxID=1912891 RepID=UPI002ED56FA1
MNRDREACPLPDPTPIFVYGTLRPGDVGFIEAGLEGRVALLGPACVRGTLYDLGDYPGAVLGGTGLIVGELLRPLDDALLAILDGYELYDPVDEKRSEYLRLRVTIVDANLSAWIYAYNHSLKGVPIIPGGDWRLFRLASL